MLNGNNAKYFKASEKINNSMRIIVTGGGTGGHIYPAIAIAQKFIEKDPDGEVLYVGCHEGFEKDLVPKAGLKLELVDARWINKKNIYQLAKTSVRVCHGIIQANNVIKKFKPDAIIGTGGYVCFPVIFAGARKNIPCFIHEQNAFPGLANRKLEKYVKKVFLGFKEGEEYFADKSKMVVTGNPVRDSFFKLDKSEARKKLGIPEDYFMLLSFGGSLGAKSINDVAFEIAKELDNRDKTVMIFGTGKWYYDEVLNRCEEENYHFSDNIKIKSYIDDMDNVLIASDMVISRAGALSTAETMVAGKPSILIPSPNVAGNHQFFNAKALSDKGAAILVEEKDIRKDAADGRIDFADKVFELMNDAKRLKEMGDNAKKAAPSLATDIIYDEVKKIIL